MRGRVIIDSLGEVMLVIILNRDCIDELLVMLRFFWELFFILFINIFKLLCKVRKNCFWLFLLVLF